MLLLKITNVDINLDNYDFYKYFVSKLIKAVDTTTNGEHTVDFITTWDPNDQFRYGNEILTLVMMEVLTQQISPAHQLNLLF